MGASSDQELPLLQGFAPSWADLKTVINVINGPTFTSTYDWKSLKWSSKVEEGRGGGDSGGRETMRSTGTETFEGSGEMYKAGHIRLLKDIAAVAPRRGNQARVSLVLFNLVIFHTPPWTDEVFHEEMRGCRLLGAESSMAYGSDLEVVPVTLNPIECVWILPDGTEVRGL